MSAELAFRPVADEDRSFLEALASSRWSHLPLPELAEMQDRAQRTAYLSQFGPDGEHIVLADGEAVGRVWWADEDGVRQIVDLCLVPSHQRAGLGSAVFAALVESAAGRRVCCTVDRSLGAWRRALEAMGFSETAGDEMNVVLTHPGDAGARETTHMSA